MTFIDFYKGEVSTNREKKTYKLGLIHRRMRCRRLTRFAILDNCLVDVVSYCTQYAFKHCSHKTINPNISFDSKILRMAIQFEYFL